MKKEEHEEKEMDNLETKDARLRFPQCRYEIKKDDNTNEISTCLFSP